MQHAGIPAPAIWPSATSSPAPAAKGGGGCHTAGDSGAMLLPGGMPPGPSTWYQLCPLPQVMNTGSSEYVIMYMLHISSCRGSGVAHDLPPSVKHTKMGVLCLFAAIEVIIEALHDLNSTVCQSAICRP